MPDFDWRNSVALPLRRAVSRGYNRQRRLETAGGPARTSGCRSDRATGAAGVQRFHATSRPPLGLTRRVPGFRVSPPRRHGHRGTDCLARHEGPLRLSWVDVHDPALMRFGGIRDPMLRVRDILIAAIIEIGLLNASHVIAAMTPLSAGSKWIPYEFGRAKHRSMYSIYSATWLHPVILPSDCGEYVHLAEITRAETDITG